MNKSQHLRREQWRQILDRQQSSRLGVAAFCRQAGIEPGSFYAWRQRLRPAVEPQDLPAPSFVELTPAGAGTADGIEIYLRGGRRLLARRGFDRELLIELIRALEGVGSALESVA